MPLAPSEHYGVAIRMPQFPSPETSAGQGAIFPPAHLLMTSRFPKKLRNLLFFAKVFAFFHDNSDGGCTLCEKNGGHTTI